jgi:hypothetical protein
MLTGQEIIDAWPSQSAHDLNRFMTEVRQALSLVPGYVRKKIGDDGKRHKFSDAEVLDQWLWYVAYYGYYLNAINIGLRHHARVWIMNDEETSKGMSNALTYRHELTRDVLHALIEKPLELLTLDLVAFSIPAGIRDELRRGPAAAASGGAAHPAPDYFDGGLDGFKQLVVDYERNKGNIAGSTNDDILLLRFDPARDQFQRVDATRDKVPKGQFYDKLTEQHASASDRFAFCQTYLEGDEGYFPKTKLRPKVLEPAAVYNGDTTGRSDLPVQPAFAKFEPHTGYGEVNVTTPWGKDETRKVYGTAHLEPTESVYNELTRNKHKKEWCFGGYRRYFSYPRRLLWYYGMHPVSMLLGAALYGLTGDLVKVTVERPRWNESNIDTANQDIDTFFPDTDDSLRSGLFKFDLGILNQLSEMTYDFRMWAIFGALFAFISSRAPHTMMGFADGGSLDPRKPNNPVNYTSPVHWAADGSRDAYLSFGDKLFKIAKKDLPAAPATRVVREPRLFRARPKSVAPVNSGMAAVALPYATRAEGQTEEEHLRAMRDRASGQLALGGNGTVRMFNTGGNTDLHAAQRRAGYSSLNSSDSEDSTTDSDGVDDGFPRGSVNFDAV